jgi:hypothetical protein
MPFKNKRNSRDDKSENFKRTSKPSSASGPKNNTYKSDRQESTSSTKKKLISEEPKKSFKSNSRSSDDKTGEVRKVLAVQTTGALIMIVPKRNHSETGRRQETENLFLKDLRQKKDLIQTELVVIKKLLQKNLRETEKPFLHLKTLIENHFSLVILNLQTKRHL